jgi:hypothetical protein
MREEEPLDTSVEMSEEVQALYDLIEALCPESQMSYS